MEALLDGNASVEGSIASLNTEPSWDDMESLVSMIDHKLESGNNTNVTKLLSKLIHDTRARIKIDLGKQHVQLNAIVSIMEQIPKRETDLKFAVRLKRPKLLDKGKYKEFAELHRNNFTKADLFLDAQGYKIAADRFKTLLTTYNEVVKYYEWFNYVTELIRNRPANTIPDLNCNIELITKMIKLQTDQLGKPERLITLMRGDLNKEKAYCVVEQLTGTTFFEHLSQKEIKAISNSAGLVEKTLRRSYVLSLDLPSNIVENLVDVALALMQYNKTFNFHFAEYYRIASTHGDLATKQITLWQDLP